MSTFTARLHLPGRARLPLGVDVDIQNERLTLTSGDRTVAAMPVADLEVVSESDGFHMKVDGEDVVLVVTDSTRFAAALGIEEHTRPKVTRSPSRSSRSRSTAGRHDVGQSEEQSTPPQPVDPVADMERRIEEIRDSLQSDILTPAQAFAQWIGLLREINNLLGEGAVTADTFSRLNGQLLDLFPDPITESAVSMTPGE